MLRRFALAAVLAIAAAAPLGCFSADRSQVAAVGSNFAVTLYGADGRIVRSFHSRGKVLAESGSDGWYFTDAATGKLVRVSGTVVIEQD